MQEEAEDRKYVKRILDVSVSSQIPQQIPEYALFVQANGKHVTIYWSHNGQTLQKALDVDNSSEILKHASFPNQKEESDDSALYELVEAKRRSDLIPDHVIGYLRSFNAFLLSSAAAWSVTYVALKIILMYLGLGLLIPLWGECLITAAVTLAVGIYIAHEHHIHRLEKSEALEAQNSVENRAPKTNYSMKQKFLLAWDKIHTFLLDSYAVFMVGGVITFLVSNVFGGIPISASLLIVAGVSVAYGIFSTAVKNSDSNKIQTITEKLKGNFNLAIEKSNTFIEQTKAPHHNITNMLSELSIHYKQIAEIKAISERRLQDSVHVVSVIARQHPTRDQEAAARLYHRSKAIAGKILSTQENTERISTVQLPSIMNMQDMLTDIQKDIDAIAQQAVDGSTKYYDALSLKAELLNAKTPERAQKQSIQLIISNQKTSAPPNKSDFYHLQYNTTDNTWQLFCHHNGTEKEIMLALVGELSHLLQHETPTSLNLDQKTAIEALLTLHRDQNEIESHVYDKAQFTELDKFEVIFGLFYGQFKAGAFVYIALPLVLSLLGFPELSVPVFWGIIGGVAFVYGIIHAFYTAKSIQEDKWLLGDYEKIDGTYVKLTKELAFADSSPSIQSAPEPTYREQLESSFLNMSTNLFVELEKSDNFFADTARDLYSSCYSSAFNFGKDNSTNSTEG